MAVDTSAVAKLDVEPGTLPETMAAWVIRQEREGEPNDAFQLEQIEVPEPGAFEVIVRVMAAGVNFNNVWAALGKPVSVFPYGDHPEYGHHIGGSDASGVVWKVGEGVTRWKPGDEVVVHCNQASYEDVEVHGLDPLAAPSQKIWGYETTWGSFAQFTKVQAQQLLPRPQNLSWADSSAYGLTYFTAYRMLIDQCKLQPGHNVLIWGAAGGLGVFAVQLCKAAGANAVGVVSSDEKGELVKQLGAVDYINRAEFGEMMRTKENLADPAADKERFKASRGFAKRVKEILGDAPDIVFEHVGQATFPTSVFVVKPFGKVVICGATSGFQLDFDVRYLWMRQKQIIGSHFANAYECMRANQLMAEGKVRPVIWQTMGFDGVAEAHQLLHENKHLGKISILVGAESEDEGKNEDGPGAIRAEVGAMSEVCVLDWHIAPFRADRWLDALGTGGGADARLRRQELVADPLHRRSPVLPPVLGLGEPRRLRALLVLGGDRDGPRRGHRPLRPAAAAHLAHPAGRRVASSPPPLWAAPSSGRRSASIRACRSHRRRRRGRRAGPPRGRGTGAASGMARRRAPSSLQRKRALPLGAENAKRAAVRLVTLRGRWRRRGAQDPGSVGVTPGSKLPNGSLRSIAW